MAHQKQRLARTIEKWEWAMIARAAAMVSPPERDELAAELAYRCLRLKDASGTIRNWPAYLRRFLMFKALDWVGQQHKRLRRAIPIDDLMAREYEHYSPQLLRQLSRDEGDFGIAFDRAWRSLPAELRRLWITLVQHNGNQASTARALRMHRNTVRLWIRRIRDHLRRHAYRSL